LKRHFFARQTGGLKAWAEQELPLLLGKMRLTAMKDGHEI
jgi:hypothetical protein